MYQLYLIHSGKEGQEDDKKDPVKAYNYLMNALINGITYFDEIIQFFKDEYDALAPVYVKSKKLPVEINADTK